MFQERYEVFGEEMQCVVTRCVSPFRLETKVYTHIKKLAQAQAWRYFRIDTQDQIGFPDIMLARRGAFWWLEAKMLKKAKLVSLEDDLQWQFGQLAFLTRALQCGNPYILAVAKGDCLAYITGVNNELADYPDFVELV